MGGVVSKTKELLGKKDKAEVLEPFIPKPLEKSSAASAADEMTAARRRARRGGRALLSEARLAPEQGVTTLGNTGV
jgi:hypothetical protein